jgi:hypothetical protein
MHPNFISWRDQLLAILYLFIRERQGEVSKKFAKFQKRLINGSRGEREMSGQRQSNPHFACPR